MRTSAPLSSSDNPDRHAGIVRAAGTGVVAAPAPCRSVSCEARAEAQSAPMLRIEELRKIWPRGGEALRGVSLDVTAGEIVALIGPSGAGKSTLIRCVNRLLEPSAGRIFLEGEDLTRLDAARLRRARRKIGMIFQEFALVERLTVMENVLSGRLGA